MHAINGYHAHVYFDADSIDQARALCEQAAQLFPLKMGRVHERPVARIQTGAASWLSARS